MMKTAEVLSALRPRAIETIAREATRQKRRVTEVELSAERDLLTLQLCVDGARVLVYLGTETSAAFEDPSSFEGELQRLIRLVFDAQPSLAFDRQRRILPS
jgi:hypothetical protein